MSGHGLLSAAVAFSASQLQRRGRTNLYFVCLRSPSRHLSEHLSMSRTRHSMSQVMMLPIDGAAFSSFDVALQEARDEPLLRKSLLRTMPAEATWGKS